MRTSRAAQIGSIDEQEKRRSTLNAYRGPRGESSEARGGGVGHTAGVQLASTSVISNLVMGAARMRRARDVHGYFLKQYLKIWFFFKKNMVP
eukprot:SAG31_NODE_3662_length_4011_cov_8.856851_5_plen_92_part_00